MTLNPVRLLVLSALGLSLGLASLWLDQQGYWRNITWTAPAPKMPDLQAAASPASGVTSATLSFASIQARPLFAPDRRPPPPPAPPPPPDPLASFQLFGIFTGADSGILASIDGKMRRLTLNNVLGGWTLKSIEGRQVTFAQGAQIRQFNLAYSKLGTVTSRPPPVASARQVPGNPLAPVANDPASAYREELRRRNELNAARGLPIQPN